jgi:hypothetical protein
MSNIVRATITEGYKKLYSLYFGRAEIERAGLVAGTVTMLIKDVGGFSSQGTLNPNGTLSGMARVYSQLNLQVGDEVSCEVEGPDQVFVTGVSQAGRAAQSTPSPLAAPTGERTTVFQAQRLKSVHIELFRPENLNLWSPEGEPDVYMAFGVLQEYTRYRYCCATSQRLLNRLGFKAETKPDAILVDDNTGEYVVAEFKMQSSSFSANHQPDDVDVLIVWDHDEDDRSKLPPDVVCLREIAREAAQELIKSGG